MNFEVLPNEIILDLFEYISINDLFSGFFDLNSRFNQLLCIQLQKFHLDLRLLSKTKFNYICTKFVPLIIDRILSIHISNDDNSPQAIEFFLSQNYQLRQFSQLQSISLACISSQKILDQILAECFHLPCLKRFNFYHSLAFMSIDDTKRILNDIWRLPKLTDCCWKMWIGHRHEFPSPNVISTSIKRLSIPMASCNLSKLIHLYEYTPNLEYLSINFYDHSSQLQLSSSFLSIIRLKVCFCGSINTLEHLFHSMPNLYYLKFESERIYIDGHQWEKIIRKYLSKLKIFQFQLRFSSRNNEYQQIHLDRIIKTYRTTFWIDEHQWFVQCHCHLSDECKTFYVFSLPYTFHQFPIDANGTLVKSTWPYDHECLTYDHVLELSYTNSSLFNVRFSNIQTLSLLLPFNDQFLIVVTKLDRLTSFEFHAENKEDSDRIKLQLQFLLDQASHLRSLSFGKSLKSDLPMELISHSVRRLDLEKYTYDNEQCVQLSRSSLGRQCTTLIIQVKDKQNIVHLVNNMPHLQALKVRFKDAICFRKHYWESAVSDELLEWLHQQLPSSCTIVRGVHSPEYVLLWIR